MENERVVNRLNCTNETDLIGMAHEENNVVVFLMDDNSDNYTCYNRDELNNIIAMEYKKEVFIIDEETDVKLRSEPVFVEPHRGILIDNSMIAFQHERAFFIYERGHQYPFFFRFFFFFGISSTSIGGSISGAEITVLFLIRLLVISFLFF